MYSCKIINMLFSILLCEDFLIVRHQRRLILDRMTVIQNFTAVIQIDRQTDR